MERYRELGLDATCELIRRRIGDAPVYVTFDLDCLDPSVAPAVSNLEAGVTGFTIDEANAMLRLDPRPERGRRRRRLPDADEGPAEQHHGDGRRARDVRDRLAGRGHPPSVAAGGFRAPGVAAPRWV